MPLIIATTSVEDMKPMKVIKMDTKSEAQANLDRHPKDTHTKSEMDALLRAVRYTHMFKHDESMAKMDEENMIQHQLKVPKYYLKDL